MTTRSDMRRNAPMAQIYWSNSGSRRSWPVKIKVPVSAQNAETISRPERSRRDGAHARRVADGKAGPAPQVACTLPLSPVWYMRT